MSESAAEVVVFSGIPKVLSYSIPEGMILREGLRVSVPVKGSLRVGLVVSSDSPPKEGIELKEISGVIDEEPLLPASLVDLLVFCSKYYHASIGSCIALAFPPYLRKGKVCSLDPDPVVFRTEASPDRCGSRQIAIWKAIPECGIELSELKGKFPGSTSSIAGLIKKGLVELGHRVPEVLPPPVFTPDQLGAIERINRPLEKGEFECLVVHGVTGSGKTEVYLDSAMKVLSRGQSVIYMVPEIALTPQTISMIRQRIPFETAVFHSGLSPAQRAKEFMKVSQDQARFVLGTRSAVFAPTRNLGLVVVDEEHDGSYKQSDGVRYNARDMGILRAKNENAVILLGSATPSIDTYVRAKRGDIGLITMSNRPGKRTLPEVEVVDMRQTKEILSPRMIGAIGKTLSRGEQTLLFLNKRGYSSALVCRGCGEILVCRRCDRSLTYHKSRSRAVCHYCGYSIEMPEICPSCGCMEMQPIGTGTEMVVSRIREEFDGVRILKMDSDEMTTPKKLYKALDDIRQKKVDIIVGTQMTAKGHDFEYLTLVGVVQAEQLLYMPDFRATERTFQQIVQVAGRAGRHMDDTRVIIQSLVPDHPVIKAIADYDYEAMAKNENSIREMTDFPPFSHMVRFVFSSYREDEARVAATDACGMIDSNCIRVLGPAPAPISFLRGAKRWHLILTSRKRNELHRAIGRIRNMNRPGGVKLAIDVDPYDML